MARFTRAPPVRNIGRGGSSGGSSCRSRCARKAASTNSDMVRPCRTASCLSRAIVASLMLSVVFIWTTMLTVRIDVHYPVPALGRDTTRRVSSPPYPNEPPLRRPGQGIQGVSAPTPAGAALARSRAALAAAAAGLRGSAAGDAHDRDQPAEPVRAARSAHEVRLIASDADEVLAHCQAGVALILVERHGHFIPNRRSSVKASRVVAARAWLNGCHQSGGRKLDNCQSSIMICI